MICTIIGSSEVEVVVVVAVVTACRKTKPDGEKKSGGINKIRIEIGPSPLGEMTTGEMTIVGTILTGCLCLPEV